MQVFMFPGVPNFLDFHGICFLCIHQCVFSYSLMSLSSLSLRVNLSDSLLSSPYTFPLDFFSWETSLRSWVFSLWSEPVALEACGPGIFLAFFLHWIPYFLYEHIFLFLVLSKKDSLRENKKGKRSNYFDILHLLKYFYSALTLEW